MQKLVDEAKRNHGQLEAGQCYHLVIPSVLGGAYSSDNIRRINLVEWLSASGDMAKQIEKIPDGTKIKLKTIR